MKKLIALVLAAMLCMTACIALAADLKIGAVMLGDETEGYTLAHMEGIKQAAAELYALLLEQCPIAPICFKSSTILLTPGAVDAITPTLNDPFFAMERWKVHIS